MAIKITAPHLLTSHEVMGLKEADLVSKLKLMTTSELEQHAETIMKEMGSSAYSANMSAIMKALKEAPATEKQFQTVQNTLETLLPNKAYFSDIYARLAAIVMMIISRKFQALL
jgi:hypothetical protein